jgi:2-(1,2-epoxy-1,2-dihydrophenyl)acetyl-CoA isomerase
MEFEEILYDVEDRVATITLNRPDALNATTDQLYKDLQVALQLARDDKGVGSIILTGAGRGFCAGADVKAMKVDMPLLDRRARHRWILRDILLPLVNIEKPVIAAVNGAAAGAGFNIALAADMIIASESAMFTQIFRRMALVPDLGGLYLLTRVVGLNKAKELCFTAKKISAVEAQNLGIVNQVVPAEDLLKVARDLAVDIANGPPTAISMMKTLLNKSSTSTIEQMLEYESYAQTLAYTTDEHLEGVTAFREKRAPNFNKNQG